MFVQRSQSNRHEAPTGRKVIAQGNIEYHGPVSTPYPTHPNAPRVALRSTLGYLMSPRWGIRNDVGSFEIE
ncbi:MAG: hypothetical protein ACKN85_12715, partial [Pirellula sp.]